MASGACIQLRRVANATLPPDLSLGHARRPFVNLLSHRRGRFVRCESRRTRCPTCRLLRATCPLDLTAMMAVLRRATRMKHIRLYLLFAVTIQSLCWGDVTKLSTQDRKALESASRFHEIHSTSDLPRAVLALCDGGGDGKLAEPGQKWNATDAIIDPTLPGKRLIWAAIITWCITSAAESRTHFTCWWRLSQTTTRNPKWSGAQWAARSKITGHFLTDCETGSWTTV